VNDYEDHVFDAIYGRRSIRRYRDDTPVEHEKVVRLLEAAMAAPSACNIQPWEFIVATECEAVDAIRLAVGDNGHYNAPVAIVVCGCRDLIPWEGDDGVVDCAAAIENMLLAATAMGLGSVWIGGFDPSTIRAALGIPEHVVPVGIAYFGYPAEAKEPRTQYIESAVHWQRYDRRRPHEPRPGCLIRPKASSGAPVSGESGAG
jgi:nitroreductase